MIIYLRKYDLKQSSLNNHFFLSMSVVLSFIDISQSCVFVQLGGSHFLCLCLILFSLLNSELSPEDGLKALPSCVRSSVVGITLVAAAAPASTASSPPATPCHYHGLCPWRPWAACCRPGRRTSSLWRTCSSSRCPGRSPTKVRQNTDILIYLFVYFHWRNSLV